MTGSSGGVRIDFPSPSFQGSYGAIVMMHLPMGQGCARSVELIVEGGMFALMGARHAVLWGAKISFRYGKGGGGGVGGTLLWEVTMMSGVVPTPGELVTCPGIGYSLGMSRFAREGADQLGMWRAWADGGFRADSGALRGGSFFVVSRLFVGARQRGWQWV